MPFDHVPPERRTPSRPTTFQVIDIFSGCGGVSFGFTAAETCNLRYEVLGGLDTDAYANATYERMIGAKAINIDVRALSDSKVLHKCTSTWGLLKSKPLILVGCAPCQGFSSHRKKDDRQDDRNQLLSHFAKIVLKLRPSLVVMENVPEMLHVQHWRHFSAWQDLMSRAG